MACTTPGRGVVELLAIGPGSAPVDEAGREGRALPDVEVGLLDGNDRLGCGAVEKGVVRRALLTGSIRLTRLRCSRLCWAPDVDDVDDAGVGNDVEAETTREGADERRGRGRCGGLWIVGTRMMSWVSNVRASTTCTSEVCSVNAITSFPSLAPSPLLNLTLRTHQPGALVPLVHSQGSSESHPEADPLPMVALSIPPPRPRILSVWKTFITFVLLTSQTATTPSWLATANLLPSPEKAVENDAASEEVGKPKCGVTSGAGMESVVMGEKVTRAPPVMRWK